MGSVLSESLIGVAPPPQDYSSETSSTYCCNQCCQVVSLTVDVKITCPLCQGGWIQDCGGVSLLYIDMPSESEDSASNGNVTPGHTWSPIHSIGSNDYDNYDEPHQEMKTFRVVVFSIQAALELVDALHSRGKEQTERREEVNNMLAIPLESEPSASDSDGHGARVIPPSNHPVDDTNGSALHRSPLHSTGSHYYNQTHQAPGHDDSNPSLSLLPSGGSDPALTSNNAPGLVVSYDSRMERGNLSRSSNANVVPDQPHRATEVTTSFWIFSVTGLGFEAVSAFFDQVSSPQNPQYALYGMLLSVVAILVCILDLIHNAIKQREAASGSDMLWGILPEVFGLALACVQCISSALQFSFICRHAANPVKVSPVPFLFCFVLFAFKYRNGRN